MLVPKWARIGFVNRVSLLLQMLKRWCVVGLVLHWVVILCVLARALLASLLQWWTTLCAEKVLLMTLLLNGR